MTVHCGESGLTCMRNGDYHGAIIEADLALGIACALPPLFLLWLVAYCTFSTPPNRGCDVFKGRHVCKNVFSTLLFPGQPRMSWLDMHPQVQRAQFCNKFERFFSWKCLRQGLHCTREAQAKPVSCWLKLAAEVCSRCSQHVGTTIRTPRIWVVLSTSSFLFFFPSTFRLKSRFFTFTL